MRTGAASLRPSSAVLRGEALMHEPLHGQARFADEADLNRHGMFASGGVLIGFAYDKWLYQHGDGHLLTVAPPGSGKTTALVLPNMLNYSGSIVVTDPKGAVTAQSIRYRRDTLGQKVVVLNPWLEEMSREPPHGIGRDLGDSGFNPLYRLKDDRSLGENARLIAELLLPDDPKSRGDDDYFTRAPRAIITGCLMLMVRDPDEEVTLPRLAEMVRGTEDDFKDLAADMKAAGLDTYASEILQAVESKNQWAGVAGGMHTATDIYRRGEWLADHVSKDGFDPADLKREDVTVYIIVPHDRRDPNKAWVRLVMALIGEAVGRPGPSRPVLMIFEEFGNLGFMPSIYRMLGEYREAGLKCWIITLGLGHLARIYGTDGVREIMEMSETKQFFSNGNSEIAQQISRALGTVTKIATANSYGEGWTRSESEVGVPLIRADEIMNMPRNEQIITRLGTLPPVRAWLPGYYHSQVLLDRSDPNPYREEPTERCAAPFTYPRDPSHRAIGSWDLLSGWSVALVAGILSAILLDYLVWSALSGQELSLARIIIGSSALGLSWYLFDSRTFFSLLGHLPIMIAVVSFSYGLPDVPGPLLVQYAFWGIYSATGLVAMGMTLRRLNFAV